MELQDAGALVVGGASGLGEATARVLAGMGAEVTVADLNAERGEAVAAEIGGAFSPANVTDEDAVAAAVKRAAEAPRGIRVAVDCAGIGTPQRILGRNGVVPMDDFEKTIAVNLLGTIRVLRLAAAAMAEQDPLETGTRGLCVNTASVAAYEGQIGQLAYSASKGGVVGLTLPAARDLAQYAIRVVTIAPGIFDTPLLASLPEAAREALGAEVPYPSRLGEPDEFGRLVGHIVENEMINGETIRLDGALRMAPR
jgi:3-hydroxyacyl-CoA dehydrogenase / 3-hydroxy-2-methylbutyryl-CoA dehydrogenase